MKVTHHFPDGSKFELNEHTEGGMRGAHSITDDCPCLPWLRYPGNGEKRVVHTVEAVIST